jgi:hypothetical protein
MLKSFSREQHMLKYLLPLCLLASPCISQSGSFTISPSEVPAWVDAIKPDDVIMGLQVIPTGEDTLQRVLTLHADGRVEYGPAWSEENFYRALCATRRYGDCI